MCDRKVSGGVNGQLYKTMVRPAMMYGIEILAITKVQQRKMQVAEMKMLRWSLRITRKGGIRNEEISVKLYHRKDARNSIVMAWT